MMFVEGKILKCVLRMWNELVLAGDSFTQEKCAHVIQVRLFCNKKKIELDEKPRAKLTLLVTKNLNAK